MPSPTPSPYAFPIRLPHTPSLHAFPTRLPHTPMFPIPLFTLSSPLLPPPIPMQLGVKMYAELAAGSAAPRATAPQATSEEDAATLLAVAAAANENRNYLRSKTNANHGAPQLVGVSVKRTSDKKLRKSIKAANKAAKNASAAASYLTDAHSDFLEDVGFDPEYLEQERMLGLQGGGFRGASEADIGEMG